MPNRDNSTVVPTPGGIEEEPGNSSCQLGFTVFIVTVGVWSMLPTDGPDRNHGGLSCTDVQAALNLYISGRLPIATNDQIAAHLRTCPICNAILRQLHEDSTGDANMVSFDTQPLHIPTSSRLQIDHRFICSLCADSSDLPNGSLLSSDTASARECRDSFVQIFNSIGRERGLSTPNSENLISTSDGSQKDTSHGTKMASVDHVLL